MRYVDCGYAQSRLEAFVDGELPMGDQVLVESHLRWCHTCEARVQDLQLIADSLRLGARAHAEGRTSLHDEARGDVPAADTVGRALAAMQAEVLARVDTEHEQSFTVRTQELFADMRLLWPALGATAAVALSVVLASGVWKATSVEQPTSLAAMIESLSDPGSNHNPLRLDQAMYLPRVLDDGESLNSFMLAPHVGDGRLGDDDVVAVAVAVTREGKVGGYSLLEQGVWRSSDARAGAPGANMEGVLHAVRQSRFAPAQRPDGRVVAVNMVWLFARTTVKASHETVDLGIPLTRPALVRPPAVKPAGLPPETESSQEQSAGALESAAA